MAHPQRRLIFDPHALRKRMIERQITENDVRTALSRCRVSGVDIHHHFGEVCRAEGSDQDGRALRICVAIREEQMMLIVVTTIAL